MFKHTLLLCLFALSTACIPLQATVLIYTNPSNLPFLGSGSIPIGYGSRVNALFDSVGSYEEGLGLTPNIVVASGLFQTDNTGFAEQVLFPWSTYGDLENIAYRQAGMGYRLVADPQYSVVIQAWDFATWPTFGINSTVRFRIWNEANSMLFDSGNVVSPFVGHSSLSPAVSGSTLYFRVDGDFRNAGIDNFHFYQTGPLPSSEVPETSTWVYATFGVGLLWIRRQLRRAGLAV